MAKYQVRRVFPAHIPIKHGQVLEDPKFRNLSLLVSQGYLKEIVEHKAAKKADAVADDTAKKSKEKK